MSSLISSQEEKVVIGLRIVVTCLYLRWLQHSEPKGTPLCRLLNISTSLVSLYFDIHGFLSVQKLRDRTNAVSRRLEEVKCLNQGYIGLRSSRVGT